MAGWAQVPCCTQAPQQQHMQGSSRRVGLVQALVRQQAPAVAAAGAVACPACSAWKRAWQHRRRRRPLHAVAEGSTAVVPLGVPPLAQQAAQVRPKGRQAAGGGGGGRGGGVASILPV
jgi:hypothetical protein